MDDPEQFLESLKSKRVVLDEIHRLQDPAALLKIAADHYPRVRIIATGSSTLGASRKFKDTLTGRKAEIWLTPMTLADMKEFGITDMKHRLLFGGLPSFFRSGTIPEKDFQEWMDAFWAKDIQELFRLERRDSFLRFTELILARSGGIFEATRFTSECQVSRPTIANYLRVLESTFAVNVIRPFSSHRPTELVSAPKVYGFDTGFTCYYRGWDRLREDDCGRLWEHFVLNEMLAGLQHRNVRYWRDKRGHEIDFVLVPRGKAPIAIECKWSADDTGTRNIRSFRNAYPEGENYFVCHSIHQPFKRKNDGVEIAFLSLPELLKRIPI